MYLPVSRLEWVGLRSHNLGHMKFSISNNAAYRFAKPVLGIYPALSNNKSKQAFVCCLTAMVTP